MFQKILIANRGDNRRQAVAAKARAGAAGAMPQPDGRTSAASGDRAAG